jgi:hypothetical protein
MTKTVLIVASLIMKAYKTNKRSLTKLGFNITRHSNEIHHIYDNLLFIVTFTHLSKN